MLTKHKFDSIEGKQYTQKRLHRQEYADTKGSEKIFFMPRKKKNLGYDLEIWTLEEQGFSIFYFSFLARSVHSNLLLMRLDTDSTVSCIQG